MKTTQVINFDFALPYMIPLVNGTRYAKGKNITSIDWESIANLLMSIKSISEIINHTFSKRYLFSIRTLSEPTVVVWQFAFIDCFLPLIGLNTQSIYRFYLGLRRILILLLILLLLMFFFSWFFVRLFHIFISPQMIAFDLHNVL